MRNNRIIWILIAMFSILMSIPWLVPHTGFLALLAFVPLLCADAIADQCRVKHFFWYHYLAFVLWNTFTTFWVCNATVGGGIFAILANSLQMSLIWAIFRWSKKRLGRTLPYIFLPVMWIAWEKVYFNLDISWPWLVLGNAFAGTTGLVQWYEYTGSLGGSLWVWLVNLSLYSLISALSDESVFIRNIWGRVVFAFWIIAVIAGPIALSCNIGRNYVETSEGTVDVVMAQPNFDPYQKFGSMTQQNQNAVLLSLFENALSDRDSLESVLLIAPETFTSDIDLDYVEASPTVMGFRRFLERHPEAEMLFGASTYKFYETRAAPSILARQYGNRWAENHNSAVLLKKNGSYEIFHKSRLVVGTELTPYPKVFVPFDDWLCKKLHVSALMGRCIGQKEISLLNYDTNVPLGCAVCYESVYGEYCTGYVSKGAKALTVITNDAWWGDTPGYRQHFNYSRLRAIELRRDIARCGNTGISAIIDQKGDVLAQTEWWKKQTLEGSLNLNSRLTFFAQNGDITGRICTFAFLLLLLLTIVRSFMSAIRPR